MFVTEQNTKHCLWMKKNDDCINNKILPLTDLISAPTYYNVYFQKDVCIAMFEKNLNGNK